MMIILGIAVIVAATVGEALIISRKIDLGK